MLLPGEKDDMSKARLGQRTHGQYLERAKTHVVTFRIPIGDLREFNVVASTPKKAVAQARFTHHIPKSWRAVAVNHHPYKE